MRSSRALLALCLALTALPAAAQPFKIGPLGGFTGTYAEIGGMGTVEAMRMAVEDFGTCSAARSR